MSGSNATLRPSNNKVPADGEFRIHDCPTGDLVVTATKADATGAARATIRPGDELLSLAIDLR